MDDADEKLKNEQRSTGIGPGERLQAARIQQGLALEDVASRMHLSSNILTSIENNEFDAITAPIFVKGYLRAYARIVSLDEDEMIDQYMDFYSEEDPPITSTSNTTSELSAADPRFRWTTYIVVLIFGVLLAAWWWNQEQKDEAPISLDSQSSSLAEAGESDTDGAGSEIEAVSEESIEAGEAGETGEASTSQSASVAATETEPATTTAVQEPSTSEAEVVEAEVVEVEVVEVEDVASTAAQEPSAAEDGVVESEVVESEGVEAQNGALETAQGTRNAPSRIAPSGSDKLKIIVHADTWADIKDATSYQLVYDLLRADRSVELTGQAPFSVFLGNGHGVEIMFNDDEIEVAPRVRDDNTARLKIGG
jgi:cytoskeleton protein RodZ